MRSAEHGPWRRAAVHSALERRGPIADDAHARRSTLPTGSTTGFSFFRDQSHDAHHGREREAHRGRARCPRSGSSPRKRSGVVVGPVGAVERGALGSSATMPPRSKRRRATAHAMRARSARRARGCPRPRQRPQAGVRAERSVGVLGSDARPGFATLQCLPNQTGERWAGDPGDRQATTTASKLRFRRQQRGDCVVYRTPYQDADRARTRVVHR